MTIYTSYFYKKQIFPLDQTAHPFLFLVFNNFLLNYLMIVVVKSLWFIVLFLLVRLIFHMITVFLLNAFYRNIS